MLRPIGTLAIGLTLGVVGCASRPDPKVLCGVWSVDDAVEQWWVDGKHLRGEGRSGHGEDEVVTEVLALRRTRGGHAYLATPTEADTTTFAPIDPAAAKYGPDPSTLEPGVVRFSWANYEHDFPQEIHYLLDGDTLSAVIAGPGRETGWEFTRIEACDVGAEQ